MHNLGTVIRFEIGRSLKKWTFWAMALGFPVMMVVIFGIVFFSNKATSDAMTSLKDEKFSIMINDASGLINKELATSLGAEFVTTKVGEAAVQEGQVDAYFYYPGDLTKDRIGVYGQDVGMFKNSRYDSVAKFLLTQSVDQAVSPQLKTVLTGGTQVQITTYKNGQVHDGIKEMIVPGVFLVLFYFVIAVFGGQMLNSTVEEKENRTIEMLFTSVGAKTLITGKIVSLIVLALIQMVVILLPAIVLYLVFAPQLTLPDIDLTGLVFDPVRISVAAAIFLTGFLLFTGLLVAVGSLMPTAKEASQWFGLVLMLIFGPLYGVSAFISYPESSVVQFLSLFPLTSPIPLLLRNAVGNLPVSEAVLGIAILAVSAVVAMLVAVRMFRYGAMAYDSRLSLRSLRSRRQSVK